MVDDVQDVVIRPATVDDAQQIAEVHVASWREAYAGELSEVDHLEQLDVAARTRAWHSRLTDPLGQVRVWVAEDEEDRHVVGFASLGPSRDEDADRTTLEIYTIYLEPAAWGTGVARNLMRTLLAEVPPGTPLTLWAPAGNERAHRFYRRHGLVPDGVERLETFGTQQMRELRLSRR